MNDEDGGEERKWPRTFVAAELLISRHVRAEAEHTRKALEMFEIIRADLGEEGFQQKLADPDPKNDTLREVAREEVAMRRRLAAIEENYRSHLEGN
jgi:hypothetical protein